MPRSMTSSWMGRLVAAALPAVFVACDSPTDVSAPELPEVAAVHVQGAPASLAVGQTVQLQAQVRGAGGALLDRPVAWSTTDTLLATITPAGTLTAVAAGAVQVRAASGGRQVLVPVQILNATPSLAALLPAAAVAGTGDVELVIPGEGFAPGATVLWNGVARETRVISAAEVRADIPAADLAQPGLAAVTVANVSAVAGESNRLYFTIESQPAPQGVVYDLVGLDAGDVLPVEVQRYPVRNSANVLVPAIHRVVAGTLRTTPDADGTRWEIALTIAAYDEVTGDELRRETFQQWGTLLYNVWTGQPVLQVETPAFYSLETELRGEGAEWIVRQTLHTSGGTEHLKAWRYVKR